MPAADITVIFNGQDYALDEFSLGELEWLENYVGATLDNEDVMKSMKAAVGIAFLLSRRDDPEFTIEQARDLKLKVLDQDQAKANGVAKRRPTKAAGRSGSAGSG